MLREADGVVTFDVRIQPRASRDAVTGIVEGVVRISLSAPPVDDEANEALVALLSERLGVPKRAVQIVRGRTGRRKTVRVSGVTRADVERLSG